MKRIVGCALLWSFFGAVYSPIFLIFAMIPVLADVIFYPASRIAQFVYQTIWSPYGDTGWMTYPFELFLKCLQWPLLGLIFGICRGIYLNKHPSAKKREIPN